MSSKVMNLPDCMIGPSEPCDGFTAHVRAARIETARRCAEIAGEHAEANSHDINNADQYFALCALRDELLAYAASLEEGKE